MTITVLSFGMLAEITGHEFSIQAEDTESLRSNLVERFPDLSGKKFAIALNKQITNEAMRFTAGDEIVLMPPYSGG